ncbi:hypothetical protein EDB85DRAFT_507758 [Lactarius pseudohatsudake]|nr:hypothetical protein EDB85DRAFT_507758 [Lactarius pseudohatsudake]
MSEEQPRLLERNVDVLGVIAADRRTGGGRGDQDGAHTHLELDSKVTLGVLCDQIVSPDDPTEDEDKTIRERPEALVVAFLAQDPRKPLLTQPQGQRRGAAEQEDALIDTLIKAVSKSSAADVAKIIEDILVFLPSFNDGPGPPTAHGRRLSAQGGPPAWAEPGEPGAVPRVPQAVGLLCHVKGAADLAHLLRFYCTSSLMGKMTLGRLPQDPCMFFITRLAGALAACSHRKSPESSELASMRRQVVDVLTIILPVRLSRLLRPTPLTPKQFFVQVAPSDAQAWGSCEILLHTCQQVGGP